MNVPAIILEMESYRRQVAHGVKGKKEKKQSAKQEKDIPVINLKDYDSIQERVQASFKWVYETLGYEEFLSFCKRMKKMDFLSQDSFSKAKGELAEVFLTHTIQEWIKLGSLEAKWRVYSHYYIPYKSGKGHTEIDVLLVSRNCIIVFEAKSYAGDKTIVGDCSVKVKDRINDVFSQNSMHCKALYEHINDLVLNTCGAMKSVFFSFATGSLQDNRTQDKQRLMPAIDETSLPHFLNALEKNAETITWASEIFTQVEAIRKDYCADSHSTEVQERRNKND